MIESVVRLRGTTVEQIMTPRTEVEALGLTNNLGDLTKFIRNCRHSRIPVFDGSMDQVVGMFYRSREPGAEPFVQPGDVVRPGQQVGIIEAMKLMIPVEADLDGQVLDALLADGTPVEYGDRLFAVEPTY